MSKSSPPPNELADLYESFLILLDHLPEDTHPGWTFAIETVLFGGEGLDPDVACYGEQQATRNDFKITTYRERYGNGSRVTNFRTIDTAVVTPSDEPGLEEPVRLPVAPTSGVPLPLSVAEGDLASAVSLVDEFPAEPGAARPGSEYQHLLRAERFPGLGSRSEVERGDQATDELSPTADAPAIEANELAELYDGLLSMLQSLPSDVHSLWEEALETMLFGGTYLYPGREAYGEQQATRNDFSIDDYRTVHGDGERVTDFSTVSVSTSDSASGDTVVLVAPESEKPLPLVPTEERLADALLLLEEFPAAPDADDSERADEALLLTEGLLDEAGVEPTETGPGRESVTSATDQGEADTTTGNSAPDSTEESTPATRTTPETILRSGVGEASEPSSAGAESTATELKYEDPKAQRAHERAQKRDPREVAPLGEEITIVLQEADYTYPENPTIMGKKNDFVIFVEKAPKDLSQFDTITATVVGYGPNENCAKAAFAGYVG